MCDRFLSGTLLQATNRNAKNPPAMENMYFTTLGVVEWDFCFKIANKYTH